MSDESESNEIDASSAAKALGRLGGLKGGKARADSLTPARRTEIAKKAVETRWAKAKAEKLPVILEATHGSEDHPLVIHGIEIPCYVLEDGTRVITHRGLQRAVGMAESGGAQRMANLVRRFAEKGLDTNDLASRIENPIQFRTTNALNAFTAFGYEATILADLCDMILEARKKGVLLAQQDHFAKQCEILVRGLARVGIIALVDEVTGYQHFRARKALEEILERFIADKLGTWSRRFPDEFYQNLFRLKGYPSTPGSNKRPRSFATLTLDLVYNRLAPGVLEELRRRTPKNEKGQNKNKLHQWLSEDTGIPKLHEHFVALNTLMRGHDDFDKFHRMLDRALPKYNDTPMLPFMDAEED